MRISDWSSDVCSSDLSEGVLHLLASIQFPNAEAIMGALQSRHNAVLASACFQQLRLQLFNVLFIGFERFIKGGDLDLHLVGHVSCFLLFKQCGLGQILRSEEHTSELQSLMRISYAVFCLKKKI